jgi:alpha-tubulin suppressor-like RCC1 family protein
MLLLVPCLSCAVTLAAGASGDIANNSLYSHTCAISMDGYLKCWGYNSFGETGAYGSSAPVTVAGTGSGDYVDVAAADDYTCAVTSAGGARCWGKGQNGRLGNGSTNGEDEPADVVGLDSGVQTVSIRSGHGCALLDSGAVKCWGMNDSGQLGDNSTSERHTPVDVVGLQSGVIAIAAGEAHTCALMSDSTVKCWGSNLYGALGDGTTIDQHTPHEVPGLTGVAAISAGYQHNCALLESGDVQCWGNGDLGRLGDGTSDNHYTPHDVVGLPGRVTAIKLGATHTCARIAGGRLMCWGGNASGQIGDGTTIDRFVPVAVSGLTADVVEFDAGARHSCARVASYAVYCWGTGALGNGILSSDVTSTVPVLLAGFPSAIVQLDAGAPCGISVFADVYCWQHFPDTPTYAPVRSAMVPRGAHSLSSGHGVLRFRFCVTEHGRVYCQGGAPVGDGSWDDSDVLLAVAGLPENIVMTASGYEHHCALSAAGTIYCWGYNTYGEVGDGTNTNRAAPVQVQGISDAVAIASAYASTCALRAGGSVSCWGANSDGQLGDGTTTNRNAPVAVAGLTDGTAHITMGEFLNGFVHACVAMTSGAAKCWGDNSAGQLGDGTTSRRLTPVNVLNLTDAASISAGGQHTCTVTASGGVKCWGNEFPGPGGNTPVDVPVLSSVTSVSAGWGGTCAVAVNGHVQCWGSTDLDNSSASTPFDVPTWYTDQETIFRGDFEP